jgi:hypothetical protein
MFKVGDIIGFSGANLLSDFINVATLGIPRFGISHVGIVGEYQGKLYLFESTTLDTLPCEITGQPIKGTQAHSIEKSIEAYEGKVYHYPLYRELYSDEADRFSAFLIATLGIPYDELGAARSAGIGLSWIESVFRAQDLTSIYCSEWLSAILATIGMCPTDNASRWNPNRLVRRLRRREILLKPVRLK